MKDETPVDALYPMWTFFMEVFLFGLVIGFFAGWCFNG